MHYGIQQEHTLFNDLRRKLTKRSKELVNFNVFLLSSNRNYKILPWLWVVSINISDLVWSPKGDSKYKGVHISLWFQNGVWPPSPLSLHNTDGGGRGVTPHYEIIVWNWDCSPSHLVLPPNFIMGCDPPLPLSLHFTKGGRGVTPQYEIRWWNQILGL